MWSKSERRFQMLLKRLSHERDRVWSRVGGELELVNCDRLQKVTNRNDPYKGAKFCDSQVSLPVRIHQIGSLGDGAVKFDADDRTAHDLCDGAKIRNLLSRQKFFDYIRFGDNATMLPFWDTNTLPTL